MLFLKKNRNSKKRHNVNGEKQEQTNTYGNIGFVSLNIPSRDIECYYITRQELDNLGEKTLSCEIFLFLSSLFAGGLLTTWLAKLISKNLPKNIFSLLNLVMWFFLGGAIIFLMLFVYFFITRIQAKNRVLGIGKYKIHRTHVISRWH